MDFVQIMIHEGNSADATKSYPYELQTDFWICGTTQYYVYPEEQRTTVMYQSGGRSHAIVWLW